MTREELTNPSSRLQVLPVLLQHLAEQREQRTTEVMMRLQNLHDQLVDQVELLSDEDGEDERARLRANLVRAREVYAALQRAFTEECDRVGRTLTELSQRLAEQSASTDRRR